MLLILQGITGMCMSCSPLLTKNMCSLAQTFTLWPCKVVNLLLTVLNVLLVLVSVRQIACSAGSKLQHQSEQQPSKWQAINLKMLTIIAEPAQPAGLYQPSMPARLLLTLLGQHRQGLQAQVTLLI